MAIIKRLLNSFLFWGAWIVIPLLMEIIPALGSVFLLLKRRKKTAAREKPVIYPEISVIIPVYNSEDTLYDCIASVNASTYPNDRIRLFLAYNQGQDNSFQVFARCQKAFPELKMQWLSAEQGKSRALNLALYNSEGKYIINMDSDGVLERSALTNMIDKFEAHPDLNCMTGAILTIPEKIKAYPGFFARLLRNLEFMEYAQAFLAGRSYDSELNAVYTLSGAFSAFRKSAVLKSWMYNTDTVSEDTHITFQMRYRQGERVEVCENAIFFVDPIESVNKLYTQRQRWQRGSLEVSKMFMDRKFRPTRLFSDVNIRTLLYDHTFAFPRMIWYLALICLMCMSYSSQAILISMGLIFAMYIVIGFFYFSTVQRLLKTDPEVRSYYRRHWWCVFLMPFFNLAVFFIRMAGIINSISTDSAWRTRDLTEERNALSEVIREDSIRPRKVLNRFRALINRQAPSETDSGEKQPWGFRGSKQLKRAAVPQKLKKAKRLKLETAEKVKVERAKRRKKHPERTEKGDGNAEQDLRKGKAPYSAGWYVSIGALYLLSAVLLIAVYWSKETFHMTANELFNVLTGPVEGTGTGMIRETLTGLGVPILAVLIGFVLLCLVDSRIGRNIAQRKAVRKRSAGIYRAAHWFAAFAGAVLLLSGAVYANAAYELIDYYALKGTQTTIYEEYYVDPETVQITAPEQKKNLVYIYVESLEKAYASVEDGGDQPVNYMPKLTELALGNVNFSAAGKLGGLYSPVGTNWTAAALISSTSGTHYSREAEILDVSEEYEFYPGLTNLGDILAENGYRQEFLCGSDSNFGARRQYFASHGDYQVVDVYGAREKGYIDEDYWHSWGIEDKVLFDIARTELSQLAKQGEPFNFTLLTVDLHATHGYLCDWCGSQYDTVTANVVDCNDRYISEFIEWCRQQDFYQDTVIVLMGNHPRRDTDLVEGIPYKDRYIYNCFVNSSAVCQSDPKSRLGSTPDMFPTTLAALGFTIEGDRLGLGTNLFSKEQTLAEKKGIDYLDTEFAKSSEYYNSHFPAA